MRVGIIQTLRSVGRKSVLWVEIAALVIAGLAPAVVNTPAKAAQFTSRKVTISSSEICAPGCTGSQTDVEHIFSFTVPTAGEVEGIIYRFCTTPVGTCTLPTGMNVQTNSTNDSDTIAGGAFTKHANTDEADCDQSTSQNLVCFERTDTTSVSGAVTHTISGIEAPEVYGTVYIRISTYLDADFQTVDLVDQGVVASAYVRQLTVTGRVTERLEFCVGAATDQDGNTTNEDTPASCSVGFPTDTEIAIGTIDNADTYVTPVEPTTSNLANDRYGLAIVNTNASGGVAVTYFAEPATSVTSSDTDQLRTFRVVPTDCSSTVGSLTDQCFRAPTSDNTSFAFTNGQERFGMYIPCIDSRHDSITTINLSASTEYDGTDNDEAEATADAAETCQFDEATSNMDFAYNSSSTPFEIASSTASSEKVVDNEAIKIAFGATASPTTPEGSYLVVLTYVATPTF